MVTKNEDKWLNEEKRGDIIIRNSEGSIEFWSDIWSIRKKYNQHAECLKSYRKQFENVNSMEKLEISQEMVKIQCRKMPNRKAPEKDGVQKDIGWKILHYAPTYSSAAKSNPWWRKTLTRLNDFWKDSAVPKRPDKRKSSWYYRPISCLPLMWKLVTRMLAEKMYSHLRREKIVPSEQRRHRLCSIVGRHRTKDQLLINKTVLRDCKKWHTNPPMTWVN